MSRSPTPAAGRRRTAFQPDRWSWLYLCPFRLRMKPPRHSRCAKSRRHRLHVDSVRESQCPERSLRMSTTRRWSPAVLVAAFALIAGMLSACGSSNPLGGGEISGDLKSITVGSADFTESKIIAEPYAQALEGKGLTRRRQ